MSGEFLLSYASFDTENRPFLEWQVDGKTERGDVLGQELSLAFDFSAKYCTGWVDFDNHCSQACPDGATVDEKYENCLKCRNRTGFNPAFYHADSVSAQQEKINQNPHFVYLAYFAPGVIKVGISQEKRGIRRLLEQGARLALKLETFSSALIARQYEAKVASLSGIMETVAASKKPGLIRRTLDAVAAEQALANTLMRIQQKLGLDFPHRTLIMCEDYFHTDGRDLSSVIDMTGNNTMAGTVVSIIGPILITDYDGQLLAYNVKKFIGYQAQAVDGAIDIAIPSTQLALF
ncbi:DUF2797 domain-containing protein [Candidatus Saccharibacteria bacterium oral taxon 488]|nr:DUF2797 domain-containing protein [Candidatus Saccharibacteria bacterium oral taxon 488]